MHRDKIGFGCAALSTMPTLRSAVSLLQTAYDSGIRHFDTAPIYGNGYSEKILGAFLKGKRNQVTVSTKFGLFPSTARNIPMWLALPLNKLRKLVKPKHDDNKIIEQPALIPYRLIEYEDIRRSFECSLKNLQTDHIDFYLLHEALPHFLTDEAMNYIQNLKNSGFIKNIGIAAGYVNLYSLEEDKIADWDILQYESNLHFSSDDLIDRFPSKTHIYHSVLKFVKNIQVEGYTTLNIAGAVLAKAVKNNPKGKVLFSTSHKEHIKQNLQSLEKFMHLPVTEIDNIFSNAVR
jgi:aryl-alcohol dehydrogenase-like predicted oxidoreductase